MSEEVPASSQHVIFTFGLLILIALPNHKISISFTQLAEKFLLLLLFLSGKNNFNVNNQFNQIYWINQWKSTGIEYQSENLEKESI